MILTAILTIIFLSSLLFLERYEKEGLKVTQVSSFPETDFARHELSKIVRIFVLVAGLIFMLTIWLLDLNSLVGIFAILILIITRISLAWQTISGAKLTMPTRLLEALDHPELASTKAAFYFSGVGHKTAWHFHMWEAYLNQTEKNLLLILRERSHFNTEREFGNSVTILVPNSKTLKLIDNILEKKLSSVFYANNSMHNSTIVKRLSNLKHVQLLHGDSDKPPSFHPTAKFYDYLFVAGQMAIDRYQIHDIDIPKDRFRIVGRPQVDSINTDQNLPTKEGIRNIVYMPTWLGFFDDTQFSSLDRAVKLINEVLDSHKNILLHFKPHPLSYKSSQWPILQQHIKKALKKPRSSGSSGIYCSTEMPVFDLYNTADLLITDISSVMIDYLYSGKPLSVVMPTGLMLGDCKQYPSLAASYNIEPDLSNLPDILESALHEDPKMKDRLEIRQYAFGDFGRTAGEAFEEACREVIFHEAGN